MPLDETGVRDASYGAAGFTESGRAHAKGDREPLRRSLRKLSVALALLRREDFPAWASLIGPYLGDPADPGLVGHMRERVREHDAENQKRRKRGQQERVAHVTFRRELEKHDRAIRKLARTLGGHRLHAVYPRLMSSKEREAGERANREVLAYLRQVQNYRSFRSAVKACSVKFGVSEEEVMRIHEFREEIAPDACVEAGCDRAVWRRDLCSRHYQAMLRREKRERRAG